MTSTTCRARRESGAAGGSESRWPAVWKLHGFHKLDYAAALAAMSKGACSATVALAAGSRARTRAALRVVGTRIVAKLRDHQAVYAEFARQGFALEDFCRSVVEATQATRKVRYFYRGRLVDEYEQPDWPTRTAALQQYADAIGLSSPGAPGSPDGPGAGTC